MIGEGRLSVMGSGAFLGSIPAPLSFAATFHAHLQITRKALVDSIGETISTSILIPRPAPASIIFVYDNV
jgi:hypothetical protein